MLFDQDSGMFFNFSISLLYVIWAINIPSGPVLSSVDIMLRISDLDCLANRWRGTISWIFPFYCFICYQNIQWFFFCFLLYLMENNFLFSISYSFFLHHTSRRCQRYICKITNCQMNAYYMKITANEVGIVSLSLPLSRGKVWGSDPESSINLSLWNIHQSLEVTIIIHKPRRTLTEFLR